MIYRSLWTVPHWSSSWTVPGFLAMGLASGGLVICAVALLFEGAVSPGPVALTSSALTVCPLIKIGSWRATREGSTTAASALGLEGRARGTQVLESPSTSETWLQREMVFAILAACSCLAGIMIERWFFFAEARHKAALYYGKDRV